MSNPPFKPDCGVHLAPAKLKAAEQLLIQGVEQGLYPGGVLWTSDGTFYSAGCTEFGGDCLVDEHTLFDLASLTKPVATATAILLLCSENLIRLDQRVGDFLSGCFGGLGDATIRQLLTHTSGLPPSSDLHTGSHTREDAINKLLAVPLQNASGSTYAYSCLGYIFLSLIAEAVTCERFDVFTKRAIFDPLSMHDTSFNPGRESGRNIASTGWCPYRQRMLVGEVHDPNAHAMGGVSGNSGLFSNVSDLARFCVAVTCSHQYGVIDLFRPPVFDNKFVNALSEKTGGHTISGWFVHPNDILPAKELVTKTTVGHSGFTGTAIIIVPEYELCSVLLTNRVCREDDGHEFRRLRDRMFGTVLCAIAPN